MISQKSVPWYAHKLINLDGLQLQDPKENQLIVRTTRERIGQDTKLVVVSGYFNIIHSGHLIYFRAAKDMGDKLLVIVNNDFQSQLKTGKVVQSQQDRLEIIASLEFVDYVTLAIDGDFSVCKTLSWFPFASIFANGSSDYLDSREVRELEVCRALNIEVVVGVGGKTKINSSSWILKGELPKKPYFETFC